jgi:phosphohistidine phosphatase
MKLYILRHGEAAEHGDPRYLNDADRPLTPKGIQRTKALAHALRQMDITFDVIFSSPLVRARETAEIVERGLRLHGRLELTEHLAPSGDVEKLAHQLNKVRPAPESVLLVGHEPYLSSLISLLCTGGSHLSLTLKKGGLCRMEVETVRAARCASLEWLLAPRLIGPKRAKPR